MPQRLRSTRIFRLLATLLLACLLPLRAVAATPVLPGTQMLDSLAYGPDPAQRLDVYLPATASHAPVLLLVHGGAWMVGDKAMSRLLANKLAHWLPMGAVVVSMNYRMSAAPRVMDQVDDVARALAFVQAQAAGWGGDGRRVALIGHSAGAHLAAMLASDASLATRHGAGPWLATVPLDSGAFDVVQIMQTRHYGFYDRVFGRDPAYWAQASPTHRLSQAPAAPMLIVCSTRRREACPQAEAYAAKAVALGGTRVGAAGGAGPRRRQRAAGAAGGLHGAGGWVPAGRRRLAVKT